MNAKLKVVSENLAVKAAIAEFGQALKDRQEHRVKVSLLKARVADLTSVLADLRSVKPLDTADMTLEQIRATAGDAVKRQSEISVIESALGNAQDKLATVKDDGRLLQIQESGCRDMFYLRCYEAALEELAAVMPTLGILRYCQALTGKPNDQLMHDLFTDDGDAGSIVASLLRAPA